MNTNDNQQVIKLLNDVSCMLQGIESNNAAHIDAALVNLKKHTAEFETIFYKNLLNSLYGRQAYCRSMTIDDIATAVAASVAFRTKDRT